MYSVIDSCLVQLLTYIVEEVSNVLKLSLITVIGYIPGRQSLFFVYSIVLNISTRSLVTYDVTPLSFHCDFAVCTS